MTAHTPEMSAELRCHCCGYDLRAHPPEGRCPECGASVAEARRVAAIPRRPAWRDSDPRWRRRMLAGAWVLALAPLTEALKAMGWAAKVPVPRLYQTWGTVRTLEDTLFCGAGVYLTVTFCMGAALLFSQERGRRRGRLDWTRRWGVLCTYVVLLLSTAPILFITALVAVGISHVFMSMPLKDQPGVTEFLLHVSTGYLLYGAHPGRMLAIVLPVFSSTTMALACLPLFDALRSSGPQRLARVLVLPLASFSLLHMVQAGLNWLGISSAAATYPYGLYFWPQALVGDTPGWSAPAGPAEIAVEAVKWGVILVAAVWLSTAQVAAWWQGRRARA